MPNLFAIGQTTSRSRVANGADVRLQATRDGALYTARWLESLALEGRVYWSSDGAANEYPTGQTSFADTADTFHLSVPTGTTAIPLEFTANQVGTVAGGAISVSIEIEGADPYASGGTSEKVLNSRTDNPVTHACTFYTNPTLTTGHFGIEIFQTLLKADVTNPTAEGTQLLWTPNLYAPILLVGPASFKVYTWAATTGPTWGFGFSWAEIPTSSIN